MAKSDFMNPVTEAGASHLKWKTIRNVENTEADKDDKTIHSGHFMVSSLTDDCENEDEQEDSTPSPVTIKPEVQGYDFTEAPKDTKFAYKFGNKNLLQMSIDASLTTLFECMTLAYSGKLTSPKWKNFKGIKVPLRDKIRLNNIIWREWHMQYIQSKLPIVCQFEPPIADRTHTKAEAIVLEGKYWKRRLQSVTAEYQKWRLFWKDRSRKESRDDSFMELAAHMDRIESRRLGGLGAMSRVTTPMHLTPPISDQYPTDEDFIMDLSDTLFSSLNQPFSFPCPREMSQLGNADIIQPGLVQLQPNLDDFMDTLEPLPLDLLQSIMRSSNSSTPPTFSLPSLSKSSTPTYSFPPSPPKSTTMTLDKPTAMLIDNSIIGDRMHVPDTMNQPLQQTLMTGMTDNKIYSPYKSVGPESTNVPSPITVLSPNLLQQHVGTDTKPLVGSQIISLVLNQSGQVESVQSQAQLGSLQQQQQQKNLGMAFGSPVSPFGSQAVSGQPTVQQLLSQSQANVTGNNTVTIIQNAPLQALLQGLNQAQPTVVAPKYNNRNIAPKPESIGGRIPGVKSESGMFIRGKSASSIGGLSHPASDGSLANIPENDEGSYRSENRTDGDFLVPSLSHVPKVRQRNIAPAPTSLGSIKSTGTQNNVLAQLLTQGRPSPIKEESLPVSAFTPIKPAPVTTTSFGPKTPTSVTFSLPSDNDDIIQKNLLIAAVSQAISVSPLTHINSINMSPSRTLIANRSSPPLMGSDSSQLNTSNSPPFYPCSPSSDAGSRSRHASNDSTGSGSIGFKDELPKPFHPKNESERAQYNEMRRTSHISAEKKRRGNIKHGFEMLHQLVPALKSTTSSKSSIANALNKASEYCVRLKEERSQMKEESDVLKQEIDSLSNAISQCQSQLPATGVPVTRQRADHMRDMFDKYVRTRTLQNWKFWIFSIMIRSLLESYNKTVSTVSVEELCRTILGWLEQQCSLVSLRPTVLNSLRELCTSTSILSDPSKVPEEASQAVQKPASLSELAKDYNC